MHDGRNPALHASLREALSGFRGRSTRRWLHCNIPREDVRAFKKRKVRRCGRTEDAHANRGRRTKAGTQGAIKRVTDCWYFSIVWIDRCQCHHSGPGAKQLKSLGPYERRGNGNANRQDEPDQHKADGLACIATVEHGQHYAEQNLEPVFNNSGSRCRWVFPD